MDSKKKWDSKTTKLKPYFCGNLNCGLWVIFRVSINWISFKSQYLQRYRQRHPCGTIRLLTQLNEDGSWDYSTVSGRAHLSRISIKAETRVLATLESCPVRSEDAQLCFSLWFGFWKRFKFCCQHRKELCHCVQWFLQNFVDN